MSQSEDSTFVIVGEKKVTAQCNPEKQVVGLQGYKALAQLKLVTPAIEDENGQLSERPKLAITAVLDRSGSMQGSFSQFQFGRGAAQGSAQGGKLPLLKTAMHFIREQLTSKDMLGIVTYDNQVEEKLPLTSAESQNQGLFERNINSIQARGMTNLSGGLFQGISQQAEAVRNCMVDDNTIRAVLLCTDGLANQGVTNKEELARITQSKLQDQPNVRVHTFGFGADHDPDMLLQIAEAGQGNFFFVDGDDAIPEAFGNALGGLLSVGAQNVKVRITPLVPSFKIVKIWDKVLSKSDGENDGSVTLTVRDLMSELDRFILFEYSIGDAENEGVQQIARVEVSYFNVATGSADNVSCTLSVDRRMMVPDDQPCNKDIRLSMWRIKAAEEMQEAGREADAGHMDRAQVRLRGLMDDLERNQVEDYCDLGGAICEEVREANEGFASSTIYQQYGQFQSRRARQFCASQAPQFKRMSMDVNMQSDQQEQQLNAPATYGVPPSPTQLGATFGQNTGTYYVPVQEQASALAAGAGARPPPPPHRQVYFGGRQNRGKVIMTKQQQLFQMQSKAYSEQKKSEGND
eukprot:TRINITY_DN2395_c0_g1_i6.p1 TRINITY_DN2395_c0_g1~~TRINITY_DN2395_c0_g1_i6.p1  ORF type:complete len:675 (+),score=63.04 TRINITY_DN2395_c0_g1_i6:299-2026(+)